MKQLFITIGLLTVGAILILLTLNFTSGKPNVYRNGFERKPIPHEIAKGKEIGIPDDVMMIASVRGDTVYLQSTTPGLIYYTTDFSRLDTIRFTLPNIDKFSRLFSTEVHYPNVYTLSGSARKMVVSNLATKQNLVYPILTPGSFLGTVLINAQTVVLRCIDTSNLHAVFYKVNYLNGTVQRENNISVPLRDAGFIHGGTLNYDALTKQLLYSESYCNRITIFDTSLNLIHRYHTIDTFGTSRISTRESSTSVSNANPKAYVNGTATAEAGILYVRSYIQADNETDLETKLVIDQYDITKNSYLGSFYLPYPRSETLRAMKVKDNKLYVLFKDKLTRMDVSPALR